MSDFEMVVVGCGGGPTEDNLSSYLVKSAGTRWDDGILALEAGSGLGALTNILRGNPALFGVDNDDKRSLKEAPASKSPAKMATTVYSNIKAFIITHGHLDHSMSLVLGAGSTGGPTKHIFGLPQTVRTFETLFNGHIWPRLAARQEEIAPPFFYRYRPVRPQDNYVKVANGISARVMPVTHGNCAQWCSGIYPSSAWFIRNDASGRAFLFFGDVEPDSISSHPQTRAVWREAARKIRAKELDTIFLECSYRSDRPTSELFGHLSPPHILDELRNLASELALLDAPADLPPPPSRFDFLWRFLGLNSPTPKPITYGDRKLKGLLSGVKLVLMHFKASDADLPEGRTIGDVISDEVRELVDASGLGATIITTRQGMKLSI